MLSLLNRGYYISPGTPEIKRKKALPHKEEQYQNLVRQGKSISRYHFDCIFKDSGLSYPFGNRRGSSPNTTVSMIQKGLHEYVMASNITKNKKNLKINPENERMQDDKMTKINMGLDQYYQENYSEEDEVNDEEGDYQDKYNEPMLLYNLPGPTSASNSDQEKEEKKSYEKKNSDLRYINNNRIMNEQKSLALKPNDQPFYHDTKRMGIKNPESHKASGSMEKIYEDQRTTQNLNDAATLIQIRFREYLERKSNFQQSNYQKQQIQYSKLDSFGNIQHNKRAINLQNIKQEQNLEWENDETEEFNVHDNEPQQNQDEDYPQNHNENERSPGFYGVAAQRLSTLESIIEKEYPRIKNVRKRLGDVKYYFDLAQNLIGEYAKKGPLTPQLHDLILTYNNTFKQAHRELDNISRDLIHELDDMFESRSPESWHQRYEASLESKKTNTYSIYCLDLIKELWESMKVTSQNLLLLQEEHRKTEYRLQKLERENKEYKNRYAYLKNKTQETEVKYDSLIRYMENGKSYQNLNEASHDYPIKEADIDKQLTAELKKSQKLKKNLLDALEAYEQPSVRKSKKSTTNSLFSSQNNMVEVDMRDSKVSSSNNFVQYYEEEEDDNYGEEESNSRNDTVKMSEETVPENRFSNQKSSLENRNFSGGSTKKYASHVKQISENEADLTESANLSIKQPQAIPSPKFGYDNSKDVNQEKKSWPSVEQMRQNLLLSLKRDDSGSNGVNLYRRPNSFQEKPY